MKPNELLQQCLAASKESLIEIDPNGELIQRQLWKMSGTSLISKANIWQSKHEWKLKSVKKEAGKIYIENTSKDKVLATLNNYQLVEVAFDNNNARQKWKKGPANGEGFFTLENIMSQKFLTAPTSTSTDSLVVKGN